MTFIPAVVLIDCAGRERSAFLLASSSSHFALVPMHIRQHQRKLHKSSKPSEASAITTSAVRGSSGGGDGGGGDGGGGSGGSGGSSGGGGDGGGGWYANVVGGKGSTFVPTLSPHSTVFEMSPSSVESDTRDDTLFSFSSSPPSWDKDP